MKNASILFVSLACITAFGGAALAVEPVLPKSERTFNRLDADHNGKIALNEFKPKAEQRLMRLDTDGNGEVSTAELDSYLQMRMEKRKARLLKILDTDSNGVITRVELDHLTDEMFASADADHDGAVSLDEARQFRMAKLRKAAQTGQTGGQEIQPN